jgi:osmoprotectant transport system substrate-binding protein
VSKSNSCLLGEAYTTDGRIKEMDLDTLADDKHFFPNYNAAPEIHSATIDKWPAIAELLNPLSARLTAQIAQELNAKVDVEWEDPHKVAKDWLIEQGFIKNG